MMAQSQSENVRLGEDGESVVLLDQTRLPGRVEYRAVRTLEEMVEAIRSLRVRGAPAIGIFAGFCLSALARQMERAGLDAPELLRELERKGKTLVTSRPTAVNLSWAVERMLGRASGLAEGTSRELADALEAESRAIRPGGRGDVPRHRGARALPAEGGGRGADPLQRGAPGHLPYGTALGPTCWPRSVGIPCRYSPTRPGPCSRGPAHRLGAGPGRGWRSP